MIWVLSAALLFAPEELPDGPEKQTYVRICGTCHDGDVVIGMFNTKEGWKNLVDEMVTRGAIATAPEKKQIVRYLNRNYPRKKVEK